MLWIITLANKPNCGWWNCLACPLSYFLIVTAVDIVGEAVSTIRKTIYRSNVQLILGFMVVLMFTCSLFEIKLPLLGTALLSGLQTPPLHWNPLSKAVNFTGMVVMINATVYKTDPIFTGLGHGQLPLLLTKAIGRYVSYNISACRYICIFFISNIFIQGKSIQ